ncbi:MAG: ParA family protein [Lachnospiraceae bacterium]|nr:ParA family protein [Lachnospiraceae bacterium]
MSRVIAVTNQKGGVGKTTTTVNLSSALAEAGKRVLVIDMDPQGNTTTGLGVNKILVEQSSYDLLIDDDPMVDVCKVKLEWFDSFYLIPSNINLAGAEIELATLPNSFVLLKEQLDPIRDQYDYILIDCPPSLSILTLNALTAADSVLIPLQCEYYAIEGVSDLMKTVDKVRDNLNEYLQVEGILFTMFDSRTNLSKEVIENVKANMGTMVFETIIPVNVRLAESPSYGMPINIYDKRSAGAESYYRLAEEVIRRG